MISLTNAQSDGTFGLTPQVTEVIKGSGECAITDCHVKEGLKKCKSLGSPFGLPELLYRFNQVHNVKEYHIVRKNTKCLPGKLSTNIPAGHYEKYSLNGLVHVGKHNSCTVSQFVYVLI